LSDFALIDGLMEFDILYHSELLNFTATIIYKSINT